MASNQMMMYSLDRSERQLLFALREGGVFIFYSHIKHGFDWLKQEDQAHIDEALTKLRTAFQAGRVPAVTAGEPMTVNGTELHTMLVTMGIPCGPYMLLRRRGMADDMAHTPYFFRSKEQRDRAVDFIAAPLTGGEQMPKSGDSKK